MIGSQRTVTWGKKAVCATLWWMHWLNWSGSRAGAAFSWKVISNGLISRYLLTGISWEWDGETNCILIWACPWACVPQQWAARELPMLLSLSWDPKGLIWWLIWMIWYRLRCGGMPRDVLTLWRRLWGWWELSKLSTSQWVHAWRWYLSVFSLTRRSSS